MIIVKLECAALASQRKRFKSLSWSKKTSSSLELCADPEAAMFVLKNHKYLYLASFLPYIQKLRRNAVKLRKNAVSTGIATNTANFCLNYTVTFINIQKLFFFFSYDTKLLDVFLGRSCCTTSKYNCILSFSAAKFRNPIKQKAAD